MMGRMHVGDTNWIDPLVLRPSNGRAPARKKSKASSRKKRRAFDPKAFLAKMGEGKTVSKYQKDQIVFSQGGVADTIFYVLKGLSMLPRPMSPHSMRPRSAKTSTKPALSKAKTWTVEYHWLECQCDRLPALVAGLVRR
jgi:hypothetical protein